ncbi:hypothetical protein HYW55_00900 [Candidatus Gottesmanbacteria bacterium]|nr:hypothetical protein [Candidatus Gottesmanbacteria bacterium]
MLKGFFFIAAVALIAVISHRRGRLEEKVFKRVPVSDWLTIFLFPLLFYIGWYSIVRNILLRPSMTLFPLGDFDLIAIMLIFFAGAYVGDGIHFTGKIMWRYLRQDKRALSYRVNEMFHGRLSHYLIFLNSLFVCFMLGILEINHPLEDRISDLYLISLILASVILGISSTKSIFFTSQWFGGYNKPLFFLVVGLTFLLIGFTNIYDVNLRYYPVTIFTTSTFFTIIATYSLRFFLVFFSLSEKKRLQFLVRFLHIT